MCSAIAFINSGGTLFPTLAPRVVAKFPDSRLGTYRFPPANKTVTFSGSTSCDFSFSGKEVEAAFPIEIRAMVSARLASARVLRWKALDVEVIL
jgi:hypothetical protein